MKKYWRIFKGIVRAGVVTDLEYRANLIARALGDFIWYAAQISIFEVLFHHTQRIGSWNLEQTRVFLGVLFVADAAYAVLFNDSLERFTDIVRRGDLDLLLAKPVNSQFMLSLQKFNSGMLTAFIFSCSWLFWSIAQLPDFNWFRTLWLIALLPAGTITIYVTRFFISATAVIFTRSDNLQFLWYQIYRLGLRPDSIYVPWFKFVILTILPVGFVASVPARALLDPPNIGLFLWAIGWTLGLLFASHKFWKYALRHYTSASS